MQKQLFLTVGTLLLATLFSFAQGLEKYQSLSSEAWRLYEAKEYRQSAETYMAAFTANGGKGSVSDHYNAACSWALAGEVDSAFTQLFKIIEDGNFTAYDHMTTETHLNALHDDPRWELAKVAVKANKEKAEANLDQELVAILDTIYREDQQYRRQIDSIENQYGRDSEEMRAHWKLIHEKDSINLIKVTQLLDEHGWLGADIVGKRGNSALFLVIQHAELETQEKYLPMMREAVEKGNARGSSLALLEDRVALRQGKRQIYGSQIGRDPESGEFYVLPLEDPLNVDKRRAEVGLGPLQGYVSHWGLTWDAEAYLKQLPEIEARQKK